MRTRSNGTCLVVGVLIHLAAVPAALAATAGTAKPEEFKRPTTLTNAEPTGSASRNPGSEIKPSEKKSDEVLEAYLRKSESGQLGLGIDLD